MTDRLKEIRERHDIADCQYIFGNEGRDSLLSLLWEAHPDRGELLTKIESLELANKCLILDKDKAEAQLERVREELDDALK